MFKIPLKADKATCGIIYQNWLGKLVTSIFLTAHDAMFDVRHLKDLQEYEAVNHSYQLELR